MARFARLVVPGPETRAGILAIADGNQNILYSNCQGQMLLKVFNDVTGTYAYTPSSVRVNWRAGFLGFSSWPGMLQRRRG